MKNLFSIAALIAAGFCCVGSALAEPGGRQSDIDHILKEMLPERVETLRYFCMMGEEKGGDPGEYFGNPSPGNDFPDAMDNCVAALTRVAHDHTLPEAYKRLRTELRVSTDGYENMPMQIRAAALKGSKTVEVIDGRAIKILPSMAFDAGFTVAYMNGAPEQGAMDETRMRETSNSCLAKGESPGICYAVGYVYGARAYKAHSRR